MRKGKGTKTGRGTKTERGAKMGRGTKTGGGAVVGRGTDIGRGRTKPTSTMTAIKEYMSKFPTKKGGGVGRRKKVFI